MRSLTTFSTLVLTSAGILLSKSWNGARPALPIVVRPSKSPFLAIAMVSVTLLVSSLVAEVMRHF